MTDNRTTELLCKLLDERGVEWWYSRYGEQVVFQVGEVKWFVNDGCRDGMVELSTILITPDQAIAATLGGEYKRGYEDGLHANTKAAFAAAKQAIAVTLDGKTELNELLDEFERECFMLRVEASETRAKDDAVRKSYERIRDEFAGRIAATLGSEREKALEELVQDWQALYEGLQAIVDELNAELGSGTCEWLLEHSGTLYDKWRCSKCGYLHVESRTDGGATDFEPNFCPNCGKAVGR